MEPISGTRTREARRESIGTVTGPSARAVQLVIASSLVALSATSSVARAQPSASVGETLSLSGALEVARASHPDVRAMRERASAADQVAALVSRPNDPVVYLSADHIPLMGGGADVSGGFSIAAPLGGVLRNRGRAARAVASGRRDEIEQMALDVELDVTMAFYTLLYARSLTPLLDGQRQIVEQLLAAATARYSAGLGSQADVLRVQSERARIGALARTVEGLRVAGEGMLNAAMGSPAGTAIPPLEGPSFDVPASIEEALAEAARVRPELSARAAYILGARADVAVMRGMYRPMIMTSVGGAYTMSDGPGVMTMLGFSVPIFRDRLRAGVAQARAMQSMAEAELDAERLRVEGEVARAYGDCTATSGRAVALRDEVIPIGRQTVDAMLAEYAAGRVPLVSPIEAARSLFASQIESLAVELELGMAHARLARALGRSLTEAP